MQDFFNKLYNIENFTLYLIIAISVLVVLFFIILFLGKKDQKIEETKRLEKLSLEKDAFKEEKTETKVEAKKENVDILLPPIPSPSELEVPKVDEIKEEVKEPEEVKVPVLEEIKPEPIKVEEVPVSEIKKEIVPEVKEEVKPVVPPLTEEPKVEVPEIKPEVTPEPVISNEIKLPELNFDEVINELDKTEEEKPVEEEKTFKKSEVFSSVYAPKKDEVIDLTNVSAPADETIDLPKKKEKVGEVKSFDFEQISGETYNIDK